jgi:hypothetical protein
VNSCVNAMNLQSKTMRGRIALQSTYVRNKHQRFFAFRVSFGNARVLAALLSRQICKTSNKH